MMLRKSLYLFACTNISAFHLYVPSLRAHRPLMSLSSQPSSDLLEGLPLPLILGSGSFTRKLILKEMKIDFKVIKRPIDEQGLGDREKDDPKDLVLKLAKAKCNHLVTEMKVGNCDNELPKDMASYIVLTGDQVVTHEGNILEKPESVEEAKKFVAGYGRSPPATVGSCVITHIPSGIQVSGVDVATIHFRETIADIDGDGQGLVDRLVAMGEPILSCAGGLMIEHELTKEHLDHIDGTEDSVMGLSKRLVEQLLQELRTQLKEADMIK